MSRQNDLPDINSSKEIERVEATVFKLLEEHPEGLRSADLNKKIEESDSSFHSKTVYGCVRKLDERYFDQVHKPSKRLFRLLKYEAA